jgi:KipI family sensor histidine kinase inhibitor
MLTVQAKKISGVIETVPTYRSLLVYFDPRQISAKKLRETLYSLTQPLAENGLPKPKLIEIPTAYGGEYGPDLEFVAAYNGLSVPEVVEIHIGTPYLIYMIGFVPGFPYLGGMSPRIVTPRLETPRAKITAGSVGIAGNQTGIYPVESPGGWRLIGRTPLKLFDPIREPLALFQAGDYLTFVSITPEEFSSIKEAVEQQTYLVKETLLE